MTRGSKRKFEPAPKKSSRVWLKRLLPDLSYISTWVFTAVIMLFVPAAIVLSGGLRFPLASVSPAQVMFRFGVGASGACAWVSPAQEMLRFGVGPGAAAAPMPASLRSPAGCEAIQPLVALP